MMFVVNKYLVFTKTLLDSVKESYLELNVPLRINELLCTL